MTQTEGYASTAYRKSLPRISLNLSADKKVTFRETDSIIVEEPETPAKTN